MCEALLDSSAPPQDLDKARWAIFYSISNTQPGLKGISFGNFLLKRVVEQLLQVAQAQVLRHAVADPRFLGLAGQAGRQRRCRASCAMARDASATAATTASAGSRTCRERPRGKAPEALRRAGFRLAAHYLQSMKNGAPLDAVARFHLSNGARIERLNWAADTSARA